MNGKLLLPLALAAALGSAACDGSSTGPGGDAALSASEANQMAGDFDEVSAGGIDGEFAPLFSASADGAGALAATTVDATFTRTVSCPRGGSVTVVGHTTGTMDRPARSASRQTDATRTEQGCAFAARNGTTLTLNGNPNVALHADQSVTGGVPGKRTMTQKGAFTWARSTGQTGSCTVDLVSTHDPATRTATVRGTFCNRTVSITRTRS
jgi:hypothetical protein